MPVPKGTKFRHKKNKDGSTTRLAITPGGKVVETKKFPKKRRKKRATATQS